MNIERQMKYLVLREIDDRIALSQSLLEQVLKENIKKWKLLHTNKTIKIKKESEGLAYVLSNLKKEGALRKNENGYWVKGSSFHLTLKRYVLSCSTDSDLMFDAEVSEDLDISQYSQDEELLNNSIFLEKDLDTVINYLVKFSKCELFLNDGSLVINR